MKYKRKYNNKENTLNDAIEYFTNLDINNYHKDKEGYKDKDSIKSYKHINNKHTNNKHTNNNTNKHNHTNIPTYILKSIYNNINPYIKEIILSNPSNSMKIEQLINNSNIEQIEILINKIKLKRIIRTKIGSRVIQRIIIRLNELYNNNTKSGRCDKSSDSKGGGCDKSNKRIKNTNNNNSITTNNNHITTTTNNHTTTNSIINTIINKLNIFFIKDIKEYIIQSNSTYVIREYFILLNNIKRRNIKDIIKELKNNKNIILSIIQDNCDMCDIGDNISDNKKSRGGDSRKNENRDKSNNDNRKNKGDKDKGNNNITTTNNNNTTTITTTITTNNNITKSTTNSKSNVILLTVLEYIKIIKSKRIIKIIIDKYYNSIDTPSMSYFFEPLIKDILYKYSNNKCDSKCDSKDKCKYNDTTTNHITTKNITAKNINYLEYFYNKIKNNINKYSIDPYANYVIAILIKYYYTDEYINILDIKNINHNIIYILLDTIINRYGNSNKLDGGRYDRLSGRKIYDGSNNTHTNNNNITNNNTITTNNINNIIKVVDKIISIRYKSIEYMLFNNYNNKDIDYKDIDSKYISIIYNYIILIHQYNLYSNSICDSSNNGNRDNRGSIDNNDKDSNNTTNNNITTNNNHTTTNSNINIITHINNKIYKSISTIMSMYNSEWLFKKSSSYIVICYLLLNDNNNKFIIKNRRYFKRMIRYKCGIEILKYMRIYCNEEIRKEIDNYINRIKVL